MPIHEALKSIKKTMPKTVTSYDEQLVGISTGSIAVDSVTGNGGFPRGRISEVFGWEACLAEDTPIHYTSMTPEGLVRNCKGGTLERLHKRFHAIRVGVGRLPASDSAFYVPSVNEEDRVFLNRVVDVVATGERECFEVVTCEGQRLTATADHQFYTGHGFTPLRDLDAGAEVMMHLNIPFQCAESADARHREDRKYLYVKHHPVAGVHVVNGRYRYVRLLKSRAVVEAHQNGLPFDEYLQRLNDGQIDGLTFLARKDHVHHRDDDYTNDVLDNLQVLRASEHGRLHAAERHNNLRFAATPLHVGSITEVGPRQTYDIKMASPFNNYVANKFVVHNSGKTMLCITACAQAQRDGLFVAYVDPEHGVDLSLAKRIGFQYDDDRLGVYYTPQSFEQTCVIVEKLVESGEVALIVVDSVPAMVPEAELEGDIIEVGAIAERARRLAAVLPRFVKSIAEHDTALVFVNQMRSKIETGFAAKFQHIKEQSSGGAALKFYSSLRLSLRVVKEGAVTRSRVDPWTGKDEKVAVANWHEVKAFKNKVSTPYRKATFTIRYDDELDRWGIDNIQSVLDLAQTQGLIDKKAGGYFSYKGPGAEEDVVALQGEERMYAYLVEHPEIVSHLRKALHV